MYKLKDNNQSNELKNVLVKLDTIKNKSVDFGEELHAQKPMLEKLNGDIGQSIALIKRTTKRMRKISKNAQNLVKYFVFVFYL